MNNHTVGLRTRYLPISACQEMMIATALDPETHIGYDQIQTVRWGFRITPSASVRTLKRAFDKLVARHDSLRLQFVRDPSGAGWKAEILPEHPVGLIVKDLSTLPRSEQDAVIADIATTSKTALSDPLFDLHLFKCGAQGDVVVGRAHHSIIDGFGLVVLIEDLLKFVLNMPALRSAVSHEQFITARLDKIEKNRAASEAFWFDRLLPPPNEPVIGRVAKGLPTASSRVSSNAVAIGRLLEDGQSRKLDLRAKETGISAFSWIHAAFSDVLCDLAKQDEVLINSILGRQDPALSNFVGAEYQEVMIRFRKEVAGLEESARRVQAEIAAAAAATPTDLFFSLNSRIAREVKKTDAHAMRFLVHNLVPTGRLANSPFSKLFSGAMQGRISIGIVTIERLEWPYEAQFAEIFVPISRVGAGTNAALIAQEAAFSQTEVQEMARAMVNKLGL